MTKRWSSTASMDGQTKQQASKSERRNRFADMATCVHGCFIGDGLWCTRCDEEADNQQKANGT